VLLSKQTKEEIAIAYVRRTQQALSMGTMGFAVFTIVAIGGLVLVYTGKTQEGLTLLGTASPAIIAIVNWLGKTGDGLVKIFSTSEGGAENS
jgi:hypothetical protein